MACLPTLPTDCLWLTPMATSKSTGSASPSRPLTSGTVTSRAIGSRCLRLSVYGPFTPETGFRYNPLKLLIGPYARAIPAGLTGPVPDYGYPIESHVPTAISSSTSATARPTCRGGRRPGLQWGRRQPRTPWHKTIIYETHVKGFTICTRMSRDMRGTYAGLARSRSSTISSASASRRSSCCRCTPSSTTSYLVEQGLTNYWGYNTIGFFAPDARYSLRRPGRQVTEFKAMVKRCTPPASR